MEFLRCAIHSIRFRFNPVAFSSSIVSSFVRVHTALPNHPNGRKIRLSFSIFRLLLLLASSSPFAHSFVSSLREEDSLSVLSLNSQKLTGHGIVFSSQSPLYLPLFELIHCLCFESMTGTVNFTPNCYQPLCFACCS